MPLGIDKSNRQWFKERSERNRFKGGMFKRITCNSCGCTSTYDEIQSPGNRYIQGFDDNAFWWHCPYCGALISHKKQFKSEFHIQESYRDLLI